MNRFNESPEQTDKIKAAAQEHMKKVVDSRVSVPAITIMKTQMTLLGVREWLMTDAKYARSNAKCHAVLQEVNALLNRLNTEPITIRETI